MIYLHADIQLEGGRLNMKTLYWIDKLIDRLCTILNGVAGLCMAALTVDVFIQVIFRHFLKMPIAISTELTTIFFPWITCLSMISIAKREENTALVLFYDKFRGVGKHFIFMFVHIVMLLFAYFMTIAAFRLSTSLASEILPLTRLSKAFTYGSMVIGFAGVAIVEVYLLIRYILINIVKIEKNKEGEK